MSHKWKLYLKSAFAIICIFPFILYFEYIISGSTLYDTFVRILTFKSGYNYHIAFWYLSILVDTIYFIFIFQEKKE